jgi:hypothetical protein
MGMKLGRVWFAGQVGDAVEWCVRSARIAAANICAFVAIARRT